MIKSTLTALLIALCIRTVLFQPFTIPSGSMEPTVLPGDYVIIEKFAYGYSRFSLPFGPPLFHGRILERTPRRGDIVVFKLPRDNHTDYIKRLIGLPGDRIELMDGVVYVNGRPIEQQTLGPATVPGPFGLPQPVERIRETLPNGRSYVTYHYQGSPEMENTGVYVVPPHTYFFMGDNRDNSSDSRFPEAIGVGYVPEENLVGRAALVAFSWDEDVSLFKPWTWVTDLRFGRLFHLLH
jgi:signal peptidase I